MISWAAAAVVGTGIFLASMGNQGLRRGGLAIAAAVPLGILAAQGTSVGSCFLRLGIGLVLGALSWFWIRQETPVPFGRGSRLAGALALVAVSSTLLIALAADLGPRPMVSMSPLSAWVIVGLTALAYGGTKMAGPKSS